MKQDLSLKDELREFLGGKGLCTAVERDGTFCFGKIKCKKLCDKHYKRFMTNGSCDLLVKIKKKCKFIDCNLPHRAKGYCEIHYKKHVKSIYKCSMDDCNKNVVSKNLCKMHSERKRVHGDVNGKSNYQPDINKNLKDKNIKRFIHPRKNINCIVPGCLENYQTTRITKGLCQNHYSRWIRFGDYNIKSKKEYLNAINKR